MKEKIYLRKANLDDIKLIFKWCNDEDTRKNSFSTKKITWQEHEEWFKSALDDGKLFYYILRFNDVDVGQIRIKLEGKNCGSISYSIDSDYRGRGLGKVILQLCENEMLQSFDEFYIQAEVKASNIASQVLFKKLGYEEYFNEKNIIKYRKKAKNCDIVITPPPI